jgi:hypothetical protein
MTRYAFFWEDDGMTAVSTVLLLLLLLLFIGGVGHTPQDESLLPIPTQSISIRFPLPLKASYTRK